MRTTMKGLALLKGLTSLRMLVLKLYNGRRRIDLLALVLLNGLTSLMAQVLKL